MTPAQLARLSHDDRAAVLDACALTRHARHLDAHDMRDDLDAMTRDRLERATATLAAMLADALWPLVETVPDSYAARMQRRERLCRAVDVAWTRRAS